MSKGFEKQSIEPISSKDKEEGQTRRDILKLGIMGLGLLGINTPKTWSHEKIKDGRENTETPSVSLHIFYSHHAGREDLQGFEEKIKEFDIYIPEGVGWTPEELIDLERVSRGEITPQELLNERGITPKSTGASYDFLRAELEGIYNSKKRITFVDIPHGHTLFETQKKTEAGIFSIPMNQEFNKFLSKFKNAVRTYANYQKEREKYILEQLQDLFNKIERHQFPELIDKKNVSVLMTLGSIHTQIYHNIRKKKVAVSRSFRKIPFVFDNMGHFGEMTRRYHFYKEVSDELAARTFAGLALKSTLTDEMTYNEFKWPNKDPGTLDTFLHKALSFLNFEEIQGAYAKMRGSKFPSPTLFASMLLLALDRKNIHLPYSEKELESFIGRT